MAITQFYVNTDTNYDYNAGELKKAIQNFSNQYPNSNITISDESNLSYIENADWLFSNTKFVNINLSAAKMDKCISMNNMFNSCKNLTIISNFDTSNVKDMRRMFYGASKLIEAPNFKTSTVTEIDSLFCQCYNLINIPNYDFSQVKSADSFL